MTRLGARQERIVAGRYELLDCRGVGNTARVYRARHVKTGRMLAVKLLRPEYRLLPDVVRRFQREAEGLGCLRHRNIVEVYDAGASDDDCFIVMPWLEGTDLGSILQAEGRLSWERAFDMLRQICEGLHHAHSHGIVHRDLKPSNCFVESERGGEARLVVLDLGVAKFLSPERLVWGKEPLTMTGALIGTPEYMAPEQMSGGEIDARTDIYAAGVLLFRMLTGGLPFVGSAIDIMNKVQGCPSPPLCAVGRGLRFSARLEEVVHRALARRPEDRHADMQALLAGLHACAADSRQPVQPSGRAAVTTAFVVTSLGAVAALFAAVAAAR